MSAERLTEIIDKADKPSCIEFFRDMPEKERRGFAKQALAAYRKYNRIVPLEDGRSFGFHSRLSPAQIAVYASCSLAEIKNTKSFLADGELDLVLLNRRPAWLSEWAEWLCEHVPMRWSYVRRLVREGMCVKPASEHYTLGMIVGLCPYHAPTTVYDALKADPELLSEDLWGIFEVTGNKELSLAARDKYSRGENSWHTALLRLACEERLPRGRLLDASLAALERDFTQFHAGWFSRFHEALEPSVKERTDRFDAYRRLLGSAIPTTVSFALKAIARVEDAAMLSDAKTIEALRAALWSREKGTAVAALGLLGRISQHSPRLRSPAAGAALEGLQHGSSDVQKAVLKFVEQFATHLNPEIARALEEKAGHIAASLRPQLRKLLPQGGAVMDSKPSDDKSAAIVSRTRKVLKPWRRLAGVEDALAAYEGKAVALPAIHFEMSEIPHVTAARRLAPITELDELIDTFAHLLEDPGEPMEVERVLDGVSRLCARKPDDFAQRTGPLAKWARQRMHFGPFVGVDMLQDLCGLAIAWTRGEVQLPRRIQPNYHGAKEYAWYEYNPKHEHDCFYVPRRPTPRTFFSLRALAIAQRAQQATAQPLLSFPTHLGGWIDPRELVGRARECHSQPVDEYDQVLALLRLAPEYRRPALKLAASIPGEFGQALRYALGGPTRDGIGPTASLWIAAARARSLREDDPLVEKQHPGLGPDAGLAARPTVAITPRGIDFTFAGGTKGSKQQPQNLTVLLHAVCQSRQRYFDEADSLDPASLRWLATGWPANQQPLFAAGCKVLAANLDWWEARWENRTYLELLLDADVPLERMGYLLLAIGLAAKEPGEHGLATDVLISAIDDGRVDAGGLGDVLAELLPTKLVKAHRWAQTLGRAARVSPLHAWTIARAVERSLSGAPDLPPRELSVVLDLLHELLAELGASVGDTGAHKYLERLPAGAKAGKLARALLSLSGDGRQGLPHAASLRALERRLERATRWKEWSHDQ